MPSTGLNGGAALGLRVVQLVHPPVAVALEVRRDDREVLLAAADRPRLLHRVAEAELLRPQRPRRAVVGAVGGRLGQQLELDDGRGALADRVADAVRAGVAAADDDDVLALGGDRAVLRPGDRAVAHVEVVHREVDAVELAARDRQVARHARADREHDRVELGAQLVGGDVDARRRRRTAQLDALLGQLLDAALDDALLDLEVRHAEAHEAAGGLVALEQDDAVADAAQLLRGRHARPGRRRRRRRCGRSRPAAAAGGPSPRPTRGR